MFEDVERCVRAVQSKDARFDGWFFTAVTTTGIYCRPSCPVMPPKPAHMRFYPTAAAAQRAGFRACKRCRPDATPGSPEWDRRADVVARAMRLIADGVVDREGVPGLASRLGYSTRQIERQLVAELGAGPLALARAQRAQAARLLIETTDLTLGRVAFAAGFSSIRQFNDTVRQVYALTPGELRRRAGGGPGRGPDGGRRAQDGPAPATAASLELRLPYRSPFCPDNLFGHLAATAVPGVEEWRDGAFRRTLRLPHGHGVVALAPRSGHVSCRLTLADVRDLSTAIARCRRLLDLDADPVAVDDALRADPALAAVVDKAPGRRVPRSVDGAEYALRAVLGQQVSTAAARTHAARLVARHGTPLGLADPGLTHVWPDPADLADVDPATLALPAARRRTVGALSRALAEGTLDVGSGADWDRLRDRLGALPGIGPWTVEHVCMRALGDPDAFPATDLGVRVAAGILDLPATPAALRSRAEAWRPWRSYAVQYLWSTVDHAVNRLPAPDHRPVRTVPRRRPGAAPDPGSPSPHTHTPNRTRTRTRTRNGTPKESTMHPQAITDTTGRDVRHTVVDSPVGWLTLVDRDGVLVGLHMEDQRHRPSEDRFGRRDDTVQPAARDQLAAYFAGTLTEFDLDVDGPGTPWQRRVWDELVRIPYGATESYGGLAARVGRPGAARAVGLANGRNPVGIIVPCHRVIGSGGALTGYGGGIERKRWLLDHEAAVSERRSRAAG